MEKEYKITCQVCNSGNIQAKYSVWYKLDNEGYPDEKCDTDFDSNAYYCEDCKKKVEVDIKED
jgi:hypothetical protein